MTKKIQKTLTAALAATISTGVLAVPAMAVTNEKKAPVDDLYKAAYEATIKTQDLEKVTQVDINAAREAIDALRGTSVESAVPTFSSIVDKAQQKFLEIAYNSILKCQETQNQKDINEARMNIKDLPLEFKNPYSMAIDEVQQIKIDEVHAAVEKAIKSLDEKDIEKAQALLDDILTVVENDGVKKWAVETETRFKEAIKKLDIVSAVVLNNNGVRVVFNRPIDSKTVSAEDFSVTPKGEAYNNLIVNTVKVAEDGMSVDLKTINTFENKTDYVVNASGIKDSNGRDIVKNANSEFKYETAAVKSIAFSTKNIPLGANLKDYVLIKDDLGRNVTEEYKEKLTFTSSNLNLVNEDGVATSDENQVATDNNVLVGVSVNETDINTSATLTISKSAAASFQGYAIVNDEYELGGKTFSEVQEEDKLSYVTVGQTDAKLVLGFKDQFGNEITLDKSDFKVERNYQPNVAIVRDDGSIEAIHPGTAYVRIKSGTIERTISINVKEASVPATIATKSDNYNLVATNTSGINIDYTVNNQYGDKFVGNKDVVGGENANKAQELTDYVIRDNSGNVVTGNFDIDTTSIKNQINITPKSDTKTGVYKLTLSKNFEYKGKTTTITKDITINVIKGGALNGFKVQLSSNKLDVNPDNNQGTPNKATISVYKVDVDGNELGTVKFGAGEDEAKVEVVDSNGQNADSKVVPSIENGKCMITAKNDGTYTLKVKVGTYLTKQITINVVNTDKKVATITVDSKTSTVNSGNTIGDVIKDINATIKDQFGNTLNNKNPNDSYEITGINYNVANESGIGIEDKDSLSDVIQWTGGNNNKGSFDLVINNMTVTNTVKDDNGNETSTAKTVYYEKPLLIKVTVNKTTGEVVVEPKAEIQQNASIDINQDGKTIDVIKEVLNVKNQYGKPVESKDIEGVTVVPVVKSDIARVDADGNITILNTGVINVDVLSVKIKGIEKPIKITGEQKSVEVKVEKQEQIVEPKAEIQQNASIDFNEDGNILNTIKEVLNVTNQQGNPVESKDIDEVTIVPVAKSDVAHVNAEGELTILKRGKIDVEVASVKVNGIEKPIKITGEQKSVEVKVEKKEEIKPSITVVSNAGQYFLEMPTLDYNNDNIQEAINKLSKEEKAKIATVPEGYDVKLELEKFTADQGDSARAYIKVSVTKDGNIVEGAKTETATVTLTYKPEQAKPSITVVSDAGQYTLKMPTLDYNNDTIQDAINKLSKEEKAKIATVTEGYDVKLELEKFTADQGDSARAYIKVSVTKDGNIVEGVESKEAKVILSYSPTK